MKQLPANQRRLLRHRRIRQNLSGTASQPRLCVFKSRRYIYAQLIDDTHHQTLASASSLAMKNIKKPGSVAAATAVGTAVATQAQKLKIATVVFDRSGYLYHGKIKALAEAARAAGLKF